MDFYSTIVIKNHDHGLWEVCLNRPKSANAINTQMGQELAAAFRDIEKISPHNAMCVILSAEGKGAFCAGADLKERNGMTEAQWHEQHLSFEVALHALDCPIPTITAVNGAAYGGGLELALACDFMYATPEATFALPEATLGIMPGLGGTQQLPRAIGTRRAKEYLFTGKSFTATQAHAWGMVNYIYAKDALFGEVMACARRIAASAPLSLRAIKRAVHEGTTMGMREALACELKHYATLLNSRDRHEGIAAFNQKRSPHFTGE